MNSNRSIPRSISVLKISQLRLKFAVQIPNRLQKNEKESHSHTQSGIFWVLSAYDPYYLFVPVFQTTLEHSVTCLGP